MEYTPKEKYTGEFNGNTVSFNREWSGHRFTDAECEALLQGNEIIIEAVSKKGNKYSVAGKLGEGVFNDKPFFGFQANFDKKIIPISYFERIISNEERKLLEEGQYVVMPGLKSSKTGNMFTARVHFDEKDGMSFDFEGISR